MKYENRTWDWIGLIEAKNIQSAKRKARKNTPMFNGYEMKLSRSKEMTGRRKYGYTYEVYVKT